MTPTRFMEQLDESQFAAVCVQAMRDLAQTAPSDFLDALESAYRYRRQHEWLGEAGVPEGLDGNTNGLAYAIAKALGTYVVRDSLDDVAAVGDSVAAGSTSPFRAELIDAAAGLSSYPNAVSHFGFAIAHCVKIESGQEDTEGIQRYLQAALVTYIANHKAGTTGDPW